MNGLNKPDVHMYERLLSTHQLVAFQETKFSKEDSMKTNTTYIKTADSGARCFWSHDTSLDFNGRLGVGLALSSAAPFGEVEDCTSRVYKPQLKNRYLLLKTSLDEETVYIHVVYAPVESPLRGEFFRMLPTHFEAETVTEDDEDALGRCTKHIVVGDFNVTMNNFLDQKSPNVHHHAAGREELGDWLDCLGLMDSWRFMNPEEREFTGPDRRNRLDYCFLTVGLLQDHLESVRHIRDTRWKKEDHLPVEFRLKATILPRGKRTTWRCPTWVLRDKSVREYLAQSAEALADRIRIFPGANPGCLLDEHKRADCIYLRQRWQELRNATGKRTAELVLAVNDAFDLYNIRPTDANKNALDQVKQKLKAHQDDIKERNQYKKFAADLQYSERATKHFFRAPQQDCLKSPITGFRQDDGSTTEDQAEIADGHRRFWGSLFQSTSPDLVDLRTASYQPLKLAEYLKDTTARLTPTQTAMLDAPVTANDLYWAIMSSKNGKAPGPDGLPIEYYKVAPTTWARIYEVVHDNQLSKGKMTKFQRRAHLSLLFKAGDRDEPGNYRPLTLLNHDAKLCPKVLARRLGEVLPSIIHEDQSGFVPGRSIRHSLLEFQDIQEYCKAYHPDACAVLLDFAKAFDSVLWPALDMVLHHFGFGATFRSWIKTLYNQTSVSILLNDSPGDPFLLGAGVRQGDPLSPGLFVVFVEPMMNFLRARLSSKGIQVDDMSLPHLLLAFADDCTGLLSNIEDAQEFLKLVQEYAASAGLRLNVKKTCVMPFTHHVSQAKLRALRASSDFKVLSVGATVKLLGVLQGATITAAKRFSQVILKMRARCAIWKYRARTLRGKIVILRSIILPLLWYTASVTGFTAAMLKQVDVLIRNFVNAHDTDCDTAAPGKFDKNWIYTSVSQGGLGLTPSKEFIQAMQLKLLRDAIAATCNKCAAPRWFLPALALFSEALWPYGSGFDILYAPVKGKWDLPTYWYSTLRLWSELHISHGTTEWKRYMQTMPFWYNFHLLYGKDRRPLAKLSTNSNLLQAHGLCRQQDFVDYFGSYATRECLDSILDEDDFPRTASKTLLINNIIPKLDSLVGQADPFCGPTLPRDIEAALHEWRLEDHAVIDMANKDFVKLVLKARTDPKTPTLPTQQLDLADFEAADDMWSNEYGWDIHVLPVAADLKFRLQHNALGVRFKFQWRTQVDTSTLCVHGCAAIETAKHLFWLCRVARFQWDFYLQPFKALIEGEFDWKHIVFADAIRLHKSTMKLHSEQAVLIVFNIVRCCVLRSLWLHRNKLLYNAEWTSSAEFVKHHSSAYVDLHLRKLKGKAEDKMWLKISKFVKMIMDSLSTTTTTTLPTATSGGIGPPDQTENPSSLHQRC